MTDDIMPGDIWESVDHPSREPYHGEPVGLCIVVGPNVEGRVESPRSHEMTCLDKIPGKRVYMHERARIEGQWVKRTRT